MSEIKDEFFKDLVLKRLALNHSMLLDVAKLNILILEHLQRTNKESKELQKAIQSLTGLKDMIYKAENEVEVKEI